jgi:UDP:flavonoid glycosyltransferase YjiC (YdhE family)
MPRILMATFGSYGDLFPYLAIGRELRRRGHEVAIASSAGYRERVEAENLTFFAVRPDVSLEDREMLTYILDRTRGTERLVRQLSAITRDSYDDTLPAVRDWADLVVTHPITYGAILAVRKSGKPWISTVLAPISFISAYDPPAPPNAPWLLHVRRLFGPGTMRLAWNLVRLVTRRWARELIRLGRELGLDMRANPLFEGSYSSRLVLALFSKTMGTPQPDWPQQTVVTGFPFFDREESLPPDLERFLDAGPAPVVFTLGSSAVGVAGNFYRESLRAAETLRMRSVLLTGKHQQELPSELPPFAIAAEYAPHALLFSRAAVIVHPGGIGTTAEAMRAGRPMLVVPVAHDQFDNAHRIERTGAARQLWHSRYSARPAAALIRELAGEVAFRDAAQALSVSVQNESGTETAANAIENVLEGTKAVHIENH